MRFILRGAFAFIILLVAIPCEGWACRLALVFAIDVSRSVDSEEYSLQFEGLAKALWDEEVKTAILDRGAPVAVAAFEWSGANHQRLVADWHLLVNFHHLGRFATLLEQHQRATRAQHTAIGSALAYAEELLGQAPECTRHVVDVSSDGYNNDGPAPLETYEAVSFGDIIVNALVIGGQTRPALKRYFETDVIHGPGAFALSTKSFADYAEAIRKKLLRELRGGEAVADARLTQ